MPIAHVLLVEDNPIMCKLVCSALEADDIRITEAHAGAQALGLWVAEPPDLVLQDMMLPDMDGFDLVSQLRGLPGGPEIPILALCGLLSELDQARISAVGFNDIIVKPLEVSKLRHAVRAHLPERGAPVARFGGGRQVLVVDDDLRQAKLARFRLERLGFEILTASDGLEALRMIRQRTPDAVVADIMMPLLDGFGLCAAIRRDPLLAGIPLVLMTNSYVDEADRQLARATGADQFVVRTPNLQEVVEALRCALRQRSGPGQPAAAAPDELEKTWTRRIVRQLERQVTINAGMARRCALLSAELAVLGGISDALAQARDIQSALIDVLGACVDAGGFSLGALSLNGPNPQRLLRFGAWDGWTETEARSLLERAENTAQVLRGEPFLAASYEAVLALSPLPKRCRLESMVVVPVKRGCTCFGTLLMGSCTSSLQPEDRLAFLEGVATQIAQALALARAFSEKDASERRANEQAAALRSVVETVAEGVVVTDARGEPLLWNPSAEAILGSVVRAPIQQWPERLGLLFGDTLAPVATAELPLVSALSGASTDEARTFSLSAIPNAPDRYVTISARPLKEGERIAGAVAVLRDVTAEKATQTRLLVADRMASIGMLAAGVVHEINNPLAAVLGNLELASEALETWFARVPASPTAVSDSAARMATLADAPLADITGILGEATDAATRVRRIVQDLRALARSEADTTSELDVHSVLEVVLRMAGNEIRHRAHVVRDYGEVLPVLGNESRLCQVFLNLVVNAAQALPDGRADENEIRIGTRMDPLGRVIVSVSDTGEGISPESMRQLFVPFFTTKRVGMGTGLGLSICQRLVTAAGGEIRVDTRHGQGSTFHVTLLAASGLPVSAPPVTPGAHPAPQRGRLLLVDDETMILNVLSRGLGKEHDCTLANSARDALALLRAGERYDLILCDLMMPVMNGMDLYLELARIAPEQARKVLFLTGGAFTPELESFLSSIDNESLAKPFSIAMLLAEINTRIRR